MLKLLLTFYCSLLLAFTIEPNESELEFSVISTNLDNPVSIYASSGGNIYVVEQGRNRFLKFDREGNRLDSLGRLGSGDYRFDQPRDIDATNDLKIYVSDRYNRRIQVYDRRLQYLSTVQLPRRVGVSDFIPSVLSVNRSGELFFFDEDRYRIYRFGGNGRYENHFDTRSEADIRNLSGIAALDDLFLADPDQQVIHRMSNNGTYLGFMDHSEAITGITSYNNRIWGLGEESIRVYSSQGRLLHRFVFDSSRELKDLAVYGNHIYVIGENTLFRAERKPIGN